MVVSSLQAHGDTDGTRALIEVLLLHRHTPHAQVIAGITAALHAGALTADPVAVEARKAAESTGTLHPAANDHSTSPDILAVTSLRSAG